MRQQLLTKAQPHHLPNRRGERRPIITPSRRHNHRWSIRRRHDDIRDRLGRGNLLDGVHNRRPRRTTALICSVIPIAPQIPPAHALSVQSRIDSPPTGAVEVHATLTPRHPTPHPPPPHDTKPPP